jgi:uncharacterized protein YdiU (UPF0061 family)
MSQSTIDISLNFQHSYADQLPDFVAAVQPASVPSPNLLQFNRSLVEELGLDLEELTADAATRIFSGNELPNDARPVAQAYAGHQFGGFVPQLGDGRALLLGEVIDREGMRRDIALKGSGKTPFSRGGDGKAAVGPVLREYLIGEAMHALGIPTTRALAAVATGETVMRERPLPGAVLTRVAASHVRVGTFQYFAARRQTEQVQKLADYVIQRHYPEIAKDSDIDSDEDSQPYLSLLRAVVERQADLIARWMLVGFIHGVMNTDNMAICGETIDYGPCAFMDTYNPQTVFSSIDRNGRYAYVNQPSIALWNLARFADTLLPLIDAEDTDRAVAKAMEILETFMPTFEQNWYRGSLTKLGLSDSGNSEGSLETVSESNRKLINDWLELLRKNKIDFTLAWRRLADVAEGNPNELGDLFNDPIELEAWLERWKTLHDGIESSTLASRIRAANPIYIPRNHLVEEALNAASDNGDLKPFEKLLEVVQHPFEHRPEFDRYALPAPEEFTACYQTFCGT